MNEKWSTNESLENYEVSNIGRVRNSKTGRVLSPSLDSKGYETVKVKENGKMVTKRVGRLVADVFIPEENGKNAIGYIDGNKRNNRADNLKRKRSNKRIRVVETGEEYESISDCSKSIGMNKSTISKCCNYDFYKNERGLHFEVIE